MRKRKEKRISGPVSVAVTAAAACLLLTMFSCSQLLSSGGDDGERTKITGLSLSKNALSMKAGAMEHLRVTVTPSSEQKDARLSWSYDKSVISCDTSSVWGVTITALKEGVTSLRCSADGYDASCIITVSGYAESYEETVEPYIYSNTQIVTMTPGGSEKINAALYGGSAEDLNGYTWTAEDQNVCSVSPTGQYCLITARDAGYTRIKVTHVKAAYPYYVGVYVFADPTSVAYITTGDNIITMRPEDGEKRISVRMENAGEDASDRDFSWTLWQNDGASGSAYPVSVDSNGNSAVITPLSSGSCTLRVTHPKAAYPLDILCRVITIVKNVYIEPDVSVVTLSGDEMKTVNFTLKNTDSGSYSPDGFEYNIYDGVDVAEIVSSVGGQVTLRGKKNGTCKLTVSHEKAKYSRDVLVIAENQIADAVDSSRFITTSDNYVRTKVGAEPVTVNVSLKGGEDGDEANFKWSVRNTAADGSTAKVINLSTTHGSAESRAAAMTYAYGSAYIEPVAEGTAVITVTHPKIVYPTEILVKVLNENAILGDAPLRFTGDGLVKILNGESSEYSAYLTGDSKAIDDDYGIEWQASGGGVRVAATSEPNTVTIIAPAMGTGCTTSTVTASHPKADRDKKVIVMTADDEETLADMKCLYTDKDYIDMQVGSAETAVISEAGFPGSYDEQTGTESGYDFSALKWSASVPGIVSLEPDSGNRLLCQVTGLKSGETDVTASVTDSGVEYSCTIRVTVYPEGAIQTEKEVYLTTANNVVNLSGAGATQSVSVTAVNLPASRNQDITWGSSDESIVKATGNGNRAALTAVSEGEAVITVSHPSSQNSLKIYVRVGSEYVVPAAEPVVYISAPDVLTMLRDDGAKTLNAALANYGGASQSGFRFSIDDTSVARIESSSPEGIAFIKPVGSGQAMVTVTHPLSETDKSVLVAVGNSAEELAGITYLTTGTNVVAVGEGASKKVSVSVVNAEEAVLGGYTWSSSNPAVADITSSAGATAVIQGNSIGTAKITVRNSACRYPLEIIVQCVDPVAAAQHPYIQLSSAVTVQTVGSGYKTITADLVGGTDADKSGFIWQSNNSSICTVAGEREVGMIKALRAGQTYITVSHPKADVSAQLLVVCEEVKESECYISVPSKIISMKPTDSKQTITASLINGSETDKYNFKWSLDVYDIIDFRYSDNVCEITPKQQGTVTITISHPKAAYDTQISVSVEEYTDFAFPSSYLTTKHGNVKFLTMQVPLTNVSTYVEYSVEDPSICSITGTKKTAQLTAVGEGSTIVRARLLATSNGARQAEAEMMVYVEEADKDAAYITSSTTIYTINKDSQQTMSAILSGSGVTVSDADSLKWSTSNPDVVQLVGVSANGFVTGQQVMVRALKPGEALVTCSHEKAQSDLQFYVLVPGTAAKVVKLNKSYITTTKGASGTQLKATIENIESSEEYNELEWSVQGANGIEICRLSPSRGQTVTVIPLNPGEGEILCQHPESGSVARCGVTVEYSKKFEFELSSVMVQPFFTRRVKYEVSPPDAAMTWKADQMQEYFTCTDLGADADGIGYVEITGIKEGTGSLYGATSTTGAHDSLSVVVDWDYKFSLNKTKVQGTPDKDYEIELSFSPANAEFDVGDTDIADINVENLGDGKGVMTITPKKEGTAKIRIEAKNPNLSGEVFGTKEVTLDFSHGALTVVPELVSKTGSFSRYDGSARVLVLGDGESVSMKFSVAEKNATYSIEGVTLEKSVTTSPVAIKKESTGNWALTHPTDTVDKVYKVTKDTYYTYNGNRVKLNWQRHEDSDEYTSLAHVGGGYYLTHWKNEAPYFVTNPASREDEFGTRVATPSSIKFVSADLAAPRYVTSAEFRANTDWFIPSFQYDIVDRPGYMSWKGWKSTTYHRGWSPEYKLNPAAIVVSPLTDVKSYAHTDILTVRLKHNGKTETYRLNVYTETRGCPYNQK